jgi:molybdopterin converting factor small subunit
MAQLEQFELDAHREQLGADVRELVEKYRAIFEWDVPEIDEALSDRLILCAIRQALDGIDKALPGPRLP